ncbi:OB-fold protein [Endozoicomonas sp. ALC066]|uniref:OB-fold protein n=1 Tax=Endozoicomonas sp. ALC066 TaxID=3403078 RepID=UPI003BB6824B
MFYRVGDKGAESLIFWLCVCLIVLLAYSSGVMSKDSPPEVVSAVTLIEAYDRNEIAADTNYNDKYFQFTGKVTDIGKDILGKMYIMLDGTGFSGVQVFFPDSAEASLAKLSNGLRVSVVCKVGGKTIYVFCNDAVLK